MVSVLTLPTIYVTMVSSITEKRCFLVEFVWMHITPYNTVFENKEHFHGKVKSWKRLMDVGTRSGIPAIWSAQAGSKKVYTVEATKMYVHARELVKANNLQDVIEVIEGSMVDITLPEKVDVIISEWMGSFLLCESMIDSFILARDRWLKPTGAMYPSHARMWMAPIRSGLGDHKLFDFNYCMDDWHVFVKESEDYYRVELDVLTEPFREGQKKYFLQSSVSDNLHPKQVIGTPVIMKEIDCLTTTVSEILEVRQTYFSSIIKKQTRFYGFAGWFDVHLRGGRNSPSSKREVKLTTAPRIEKGTHWGQQVFPFDHSVVVKKDDALNFYFSMVQSEEKHLLMEVELGMTMPQFCAQIFILTG